MNPQKIFSDMIESILGAIYLDTEGSLETCEVFLNRLGILEILQRVLDDHVETADPKEQLGILAETETVRYLVTRRKVKEMMSVFDCEVRVGGVTAASIEGCNTREEAEVKAAHRAGDILRKQWTSGQKARKKKLDLPDLPENGRSDNQV